MKKIVEDIYHLLSEFERDGDKQALSESAFKEMDTNADGKVSVDEFIRACLGHEKVSAMLTRKIVEVFDPND